MKKILFVLLLNSFFSFSQNNLSHNILTQKGLGHNGIIQEFKKSPELLSINLLSAKNSSKISLNKSFKTKSSPNLNELCSNLKLKGIDNLKIINVFEKFNLFQDIYEIRKTGYYYNIKSNNTLKYSSIKAKMYIELIFDTEKSKKHDYFILIIKNQKKANQLINYLGKLTNQKKCFREFKRKL